MLIQSSGGQLAQYGGAGQISGGNVAIPNAQNGPQTAVVTLRAGAADLVKRFAMVEDRLRRVMTRATGRGYPAEGQTAANKAPTPISGELGALTDELRALGILAEELTNRVNELDEIV